MKKPKVILLRRWVPAAIFCVAAAALMFWVVAAPRVVGAAAATRQLPIYSVKRDYKVCSLTFDAAWGDVTMRPQKALRPCRRAFVSGNGNGQASPSDADNVRHVRDFIKLAAEKPDAALLVDVHRIVA